MRPTPGVQRGGTPGRASPHGSRSPPSLSVLSLVAAVVWLRHRTGLLVTTVAFTLLVALERFFGNQMSGVSSPAWSQAVHVPLATVLQALAVHLPVLDGRGAQTGR